jgi:hypothetical protein
MVPPSISEVTLNAAWSTVADTAFPVNRSREIAPLFYRVLAAATSVAHEPERRHSLVAQFHEGGRSRVEAKALAEVDRGFLDYLVLKAKRGSRSE